MLPELMLTITMLITLTATNNVEMLAKSMNENLKFGNNCG